MEEKQEGRRKEDAATLVSNITNLAKYFLNDWMT